MPDVFAWIGWALGILFGLLNLYQIVIERASRRNIIAAKTNLDSISDMCKNALKSGDLNNPEAMRQVLVSVRYMALSGNKTLDTLLPKRPHSSIQDTNE